MSPVRTFDADRPTTLDQIVGNEKTVRRVETMIARDRIPNVNFFTGPTGVVIGREDAVGAAKVLTDFAREFDNKPAVKLGVVERKQVGADQIKALAALPPREVLLGQLAGTLQAPMSRLAGGMQSLIAGFARAVDALRQQREGAET